MLRPVTAQDLLDLHYDDLRRERVRTMYCGGVVPGWSLHMADVFR